MMMMMMIIIIIISRGYDALFWSTIFRTTRISGLSDSGLSRE